MTRINVVPVEELSRLHLIAEYKEITRLPNNIKKSMSRKSKPFSMDEIPKEYVLGKGHVKFFYDKCLFLKKRFEMLVKEMLRRGYKPNFRDSSIFNVKEYLNNDYTPTEAALALNRERIKHRSPNWGCEHCERFQKPYTGPFNSNYCVSCYEREGRPSNWKPIEKSNAEKFIIKANKKRSQK